jgi:hemoglobin
MILDTIMALEADEAAVARLVEEFYDRIRGDDRLGPIFTGAVHDWDAHVRIMKDFWSRALLGTERYQGCFMSPHFRLKMEAADFDRFMELFRPTAAETLPPDLAKRAVAIADTVNGNLRRAMA